MQKPFCNVLLNCVFTDFQIAGDIFLGQSVNLLQQEGTTTLQWKLGDRLAVQCEAFALNGLPLKIN